ncbi:hypothetical protein QYE76_006362 [Lolium multiflorum]|uniref:AP2/ERF domain-containing protein n=1 Tax=Lolium multiflorum TaxID=4521 RepID=A0AAD8RW78_LOLMU|nr:hypothetical protein QYE76_006362 [Lolium multiflorum]
MAPRRRSNTGFIGVRQRAAGHFASEISAGGVRVWLGTFYTKEAAAAHTTLRLGVSSSLSRHPQLLHPARPRPFGRAVPSSSPSPPPLPNLARRRPLLQAPSPRHRCLPQPRASPPPPTPRAVAASPNLAPRASPAPPLPRRRLLLVGRASPAPPLRARASRIRPCLTSRYLMPTTAFLLLLF